MIDSFGAYFEEANMRSLQIQLDQQKSRVQWEGANLLSPAILSLVCAENLRQAICNSAILGPVIELGQSKTGMRDTFALRSDRSLMFSSWSND